MFLNLRFLAFCGLVTVLSPLFSQVKDFGFKGGLTQCYFQGKHRIFDMNGNAYENSIDGNMLCYEFGVFKNFEINKFLGINFQLGLRNKGVNGDVFYQYKGNNLDVSSSLIINNNYAFIDLIPNVYFQLFLKDRLFFGAGVRYDYLLTRKTKAGDLNKFYEDLAFQSYLRSNLSPIFTFNYFKYIQKNLSLIIGVEYNFDLYPTLAFNTMPLFYDNHSDLYITTQTLTFLLGLKFNWFLTTLQVFQNLEGLTN